MAFGASCCTGGGQGQELDAAGQADGCAQSQEPEVIVMAVPGSLVAGVGHGEAAASDLLRPVQTAKTVLPQAHPVPAGGGGGQGGSAGGSGPLAPRPSSLSLLLCTSVSVLPPSHACSVSLSLVSITIFPFPAFAYFSSPSPCISVPF